MISIGPIRFPTPKSGDGFERLIATLAQRVSKWKRVQRFGRSGQKQSGVDIIATERDGRVDRLVGVQCRAKDCHLGQKLTVRELREAVSDAIDFPEPLSRFILATSSPRDTAVQAEALRLTRRNSRDGKFTVEIWSWDDIEDLIVADPRVCREYLQSVCAGVRDALATAESLAVDRKPRHGHRLTIPSVLATRGLSLIAAAPCPLPIDAYQDIFPEVAWTRVVQELKKRKLLLSQSFLATSEAVRQRLFPKLGDSEPFDNDWLNALSSQIDTANGALFTSMILVRQKKLASALALLTEVAGHLNPGYLNDLYAAILPAFDTPSLRDKLTADEQVRLLNAIGTCLARSTKPLAALPYFERLRRLSGKHRHSWGMAQSLLNTGCAYQNADRFADAEESYRAAAKYANRHNDDHVQASSLHNLAMIKAADDLPFATRCLQENARIKRRSRDHEGRIGVLIAQGGLYAKQGLYRKAYEHYARARTIARRMGNVYGECIAATNMGASELDRGHFKSAAKLLRDAKEIAHREGDLTTEIRVTNALATAHDRLRDHSIALSLFQELAILAETGRDYETAAQAHHDVAVLAHRAGKDTQAAALFRKAIDFARKHRLSEAEVRCIRDSHVLRVTGAPGVRKAISALNRFVSREQKAGRLESAIVGAHAIAQLAQHDQCGLAELCAYFRCAIDIGKQCPACDPLVIQLFEELHAALWDRQATQPAIDALHELAEFVAMRSELIQAKVFHELGECYGAVNDTPRALDAYKRAAQLFRKTRHAEGQLESLLQMAWLHLSRDANTQCVSVADKASALATTQKDRVSQVRARHVRALAMAAQGRHKRARKELLSCVSQARTTRQWDEVAWALIDLSADLIDCSEFRTAEQYARRAVKLGALHSLEHIELRAAANLVNALRHQGKTKAALKQLFRYRNRLAVDSECFRELLALAELVAHHDGPQRAIGFWHRALTVSLQHGDISRAIRAAGEAAAACVRARKPKRAKEVLAIVESHLSSREQRAEYLIEQLRLALVADDEKTAQLAYDELSKAAFVQPQLTKSLRDAHMLLGDHAWDKSEWGEGAIAFAAGTLYAGQMGEASYAECVHHLFRRLFALPDEQQIQSCQAAMAAIQEWITDKHANTKARERASVQFLLAPYRAVCRLRARADRRPVAKHDNKPSQRMRRCR